MLDAQFKHNNNPNFDAFVVKINMLFTAIFTIELFINFFANWFFKFFHSGWNVLDLVIVAMSLFDLGPLDIPSWLVRLMRAFRIVRLFGRVPELTKMTTAITTSLFPMMNAFIILIIVMSICEHLCRARAR